jgi:hypothetical protein
MACHLHQHRLDTEQQQKSTCVGFSTPIGWDSLDIAWIMIPWSWFACHRFTDDCLRRNTDTKEGNSAK